MVWNPPIAVTVESQSDEGEQTAEKTTER